MFSDERDEPLGLCGERALTRRCGLPLLGPRREDGLARPELRAVPRGLGWVEGKPLKQIIQNRWSLAQQLITAERIEMRELSEGRVTTSRELEAQAGLLDDVVELGQDSRREPLGLVEIRGPEGPCEVLPFSDDRDEELRDGFPDAPVAVPDLEVEGLPVHVSLLLSEDRARPHDSIQNSIPDSI